MSYTPGPWQLRGLSDHVRVERVTAVGKVNIARCGSSKPGSREPEMAETWANARLIAAAPEMGEMLLSAYLHVTHGGPTREELEALLKKAGLLP